MNDKATALISALRKWANKPGVHDVHGLLLGAAQMMAALQTENAEKDKAVARVETERDAALKDLSGQCWCCKNAKPWIGGLEVINARTDKPVFELIGNFAISNNAENELEVTVETEQGKYRKHMVYLNDWTIYVVEDVSGAYVDKYHYEVNFLPEMIVPVTVTMSD